LVAGEFVAHLLLPVRDCRGQHAQGPQPDLVAGLQGLVHLALDRSLERGLTHRRLASVLPWLIAVAVLAVACVAYGILIERRWYRLVRRRIPILPTDGAPELTMLHLSDLHLTPRSRTMRGFLSGLPRCDVCVVTGDMVGEPESVEDAVCS